VAGYDAAKLLIGSWGTLGIILDVTFRLFPYPASELMASKSSPLYFEISIKKSNRHLIRKDFISPHGLPHREGCCVTRSRNKRKSEPMRSWTNQRQVLDVNDGP